MAGRIRMASAYDEVCLVIKDTCTQTVYQGQNERERILQMTGDPSRPAVIYLDEDLPAWQLAGLYTASNCVVLPYRGEGFCLPALEALSSGVPVIVTEGGPTDDFVDETVGWRVRAERRPFGKDKVWPWECVGPTWQFEVSQRTWGGRCARYSSSGKRRSSAVRQADAGWWKRVGRGTTPAGVCWSGSRRCVNCRKRLAQRRQGAKKRGGGAAEAGGGPVCPALRVPSPPAAQPRAFAGGYAGGGDNPHPRAWAGGVGNYRGYDGLHASAPAGTDAQPAGALRAALRRECPCRGLAGGDRAKRSRATYGALYDFEANAPHAGRAGRGCRGGRRPVEPDRPQSRKWVILVRLLEYRLYYEILRKKIIKFYTFFGGPPDVLQFGVASISKGH